MISKYLAGALLVAVVCAAPAQAHRPDKKAKEPEPAMKPSARQTWRFAVSGDSRNCGDVVMPSIAAGARRDDAEFYWHLGDFRAIYDFDEDFLAEPQNQPPKGKRPTIIAYEQAAWDDFIEHQLRPFGEMPVFLGIGNHEVAPPKDRAQFVVQFADWLNAPVLQRQRLQDNARDHRLKTYYHWIRDGVDFINLDNASPEQFDEAQINWLGRVVADDSKPNSTVTTIVVGMHEALPDSLAWFHSMNNAPAAEQSGRRAYEILLQAQQKAQKRVYVLASHSHFFMDGIFNTEALQKRGAVLPGWIVGTAGAVRHALPADASRAHAAASNVYGYLLATVTREQSPGTIGFQFREIKEGDVPASVVAEFGAPLVHSCFSGNSQQTHSQ